MRTVWVLGDQLNRAIGALATAEVDGDRILLVESAAKLSSKRWHRQRAHLVITAMRRFAAELVDAGFAVDYRRASSLGAGLRDHVAEHRPSCVVATEPASWDGRRLLERLGVELVRSNQFLCHYEDFASWADGRTRLTMEDFYRWQRRRLGYLMEADASGELQPATGRWNYDADNRRPPPTEPGGRWPSPPTSRLDDLDRAVLAEIEDSCWGDDPVGSWATSRRSALARLRHFVTSVLPAFGPHEDAMVSESWHLAHSVLSPYLNIGLLLPGEVCDEAQQAYDAGLVPIASAEAFLRQVIGWREYVWGVYWLWMPDYRHANGLNARRRLPPVFTSAAPTDMGCVATCLAGVRERGYNHHIQRLMVLGNLSLLAGVEPSAMTEWMWSSFVDGAEWVMLPNVVGMSQYADGGRMATKPYAAGGNYINKMSNYCVDCRFDPRRRTGPDACPFTTLYWDFLARHRSQLLGNHRMSRQVRAADRLADLPAVRQRAAEVLELLDQGAL